MALWCPSCPVGHKGMVERALRDFKNEISRTLIKTNFKGLCRPSGLKKALKGFSKAFERGSHVLLKGRLKQHEEKVLRVFQRPL